MLTMLMFCRTMDWMLSGVNRENSVLQISEFKVSGAAAVPVNAKKSRALEMFNDWYSSIYES